MGRFTRFAALAAAILPAAVAASTLNTGIFHIGNSWTDQAYGVHDIAREKGYVTTFGKCTTPGAPLKWLWENGCVFTTLCDFDECLLQDTWDYTVLQPWGRSVAQNVMYADSFSQLAYQGRSDATIFILACGPRKPEGIEDYTGHFEDSDETYDRAKAYYEAIVDSLRVLHPEKRIGLIPLGHILSAMHKRLTEGGAIAEVTTMEDLYDVEGGHLNAKGRYVECLAHFIAIFQTDPRGAAITGKYLRTVSAEYAADACDIAWEVFQRNDPYYRLGGVVPETDPDSDYLKVADDSLRITNITTLDGSRGVYIPSVLQDGSLVYSDRDYALNAAGEFAGMAFIRTPNDDKNQCGDDWLSFDVDQDVTAYVAWPASQTAPSWLSSWTATGKTLQTGGRVYDVYSQDFAEGTITLGGACVTGNSYFVILDGHGSSRVNHPPHAVVSAEPVSGPAPLTVSFSGAQSTDPDSGDMVWGYTWDFGDGATHGSDMMVEHTYTTPGEYVAVMTVMDYDGGLTDTDSITITVEASTAVSGQVRAQNLELSKREHATYYTLLGKRAHIPGAAGVILRMTPHGMKASVRLDNVKNLK